MMQNMTALTRCGPLTNANKVSTAARAPSLNISRITRQTALVHPLLEARLEAIKARGGKGRRGAGGGSGSGSGSFGSASNRAGNS